MFHKITISHSLQWHFQSTSKVDWTDKMYYCFQFVSFTHTVMYLLAFDRINKFDVFFSSCICGNWRFNCSKHSLRCARLFFSNLLWTSRVPALWMEALRCVPLIFHAILRICLQFKCVDDNDDDETVDLIF